MPELDGNRCKGVVFHTFLGVIEQRHGRAAVEAVLAASPSELRDAIGYGAIVKGGWYPLTRYRELHAAATRTLGDPELAFVIGRDSTVRDMQSGVLRLMVKVLSPSFLIGASAQVFNRYYERGSLTVEVDGRQGRAAWRDCVGFDALVWQDVFGGATGALLAAGAKEVRHTLLSGGGDRDVDAQVSFAWS